jgi:hypothetical protein
VDRRDDRLVDQEVRPDRHYRAVEIQANPPPSLLPSLYLAISAKLSTASTDTPVRTN